MTIIGRITMDAKIKKVKDHNEVVNFSVAQNHFYKPKGAAEGKTIVTYYDCSYWISTAIASRLTKGSLVEITGRLSVNSWKGIDGEARASLNFHVNSITIHQHKKTETPTLIPKEEVTEELPF